jgi:hypothetical protein
MRNAPISPRASRAGWPQVGSQAADVGDRVLGLLDQPVEQVPGVDGVTGDRVTGCVRRHGQGGDLRSEFVVQIPAQPATLLLACGNQPLAGALQVGRQPDRLLGQPYGVCRHGDLVRQVREEPPLAGREAVLADARAEHQLAHRLTGVHQGLA